MSQILKRHKIEEYIKNNSKDHRSYRRFLRGITAETTKKSYAKFLKNFIEFSKLENYDKIAELTTKQIDEYLEDYIDYLVSKGNKARTIRTNMAGIERFFIMNDCIWHKDRIRRSISKDTHIVGGKIPVTTEELQKMLKCTKSLRTIAIVHFLASTGVRPASLIDPILCMRHLVKLDDCYAIKVYDESIEKYWVFLTPEASKALNDYHQWRKESRHEELTDDSPIFGIIDKKNAKGDNLTDKSLRWLLGLLIKQAGIKRTKVNNKRYDKAIVYMFRKRFNGKLKMENSVNSNIAEKLMAHKKGLDGVYLEPTREECFNEFVKAVPELTIDPTERQKIEIQKKQSEIIELQEEKKSHQDTQKQLDELKTDMRNVKKRSRWKNYSEESDEIKEFYKSNYKQ